MSVFRRPVAIRLATGGGSGGGNAIFNVDGTSSFTVHDSDSANIFTMVANETMIMNVSQSNNFLFGINQTTIVPSSTMAIASDNGDCLQLIKNSTRASAKIFINDKDGLTLTNTGQHLRFDDNRVYIADRSLYIGSVLMGCTSNQLNFNQTTPGTGSAFRTVVLDENRSYGNINVLSASTIIGLITTAYQPYINSLDAVSIKSLALNGSIIASTAEEINWLHGVTAGIVRPGHALVVDGGNDLIGFNKLQASQFIGVLQTSVQPNIKTVGTLTNLSVSGKVGIGTDSPQALLDLVGPSPALRLSNGESNALISINSSGNVQIMSDGDLSIGGGKSIIFNGNSSITGLATMNATNYYGLVKTSAQPNITSVGTLTSLNVSGDLSIGNLSTASPSGNRLVVLEPSGDILQLKRSSTLSCDLSIDANGDLEIAPTRDVSIVGGLRISGKLTGVSDLVANTLTGTLQTVSQPNITSVGTLTSLQVANGISAGSVTASQLTGTLQTSSQPNITSVGTLGSLSVVNGIVASSVNALALTGTLQTPVQTNITSVGTLNVLSVQNGITAASLVADSISGTLQTSNQPNITTIGTLGTLSVVGSITCGSLSSSTISGVLQTARQPNITAVGTLSSLEVTNGINANSISAVALTGTLQTSAQPNIRSVGTLDSLRVGADIIADSLTVNKITGVIQTSSQPNITSVGTLTRLSLNGPIGIGISNPEYAIDINSSQLSVSSGLRLNDGSNTASFTLGTNGIVLATSGPYVTLGTNVSLKFIGGGLIGLTDLVATSITGTLQTASQPNITSIGSLSSLQTQKIGVGVAPGDYRITVSSSDGHMLSMTNGVQLMILNTVNDVFTFNTSNKKIGLGEYVDLVLDKGTIIGLDNLAATNISGTIQTAAQPNITSLGSLTSLTVAGGLAASSASINGDAHITGGLSIDGPLTLATPLTFNNLTSGTGLFNADVDATSFTNGGTLTVTGGGAFSKCLYVGESLYVGNQLVLGSATLSSNSFAALANLTPGIANANVLLMTNGANDLTGFNKLGAATITGTLDTGYQPKITTVGNLTDLNVNGFLGVGTASPAKQVEINSTTGSCLRLTRNKGSGNTYVDISVNADSSTTIAPTGNLVITAPVTKLPALQIGNTTTAQAPIDIGHTDSVIYDRFAYNNSVNGHGTTTPGAAGLTFSYSIRATGRILCTTSVDVMSDRRTKKNVEELTDEFCASFVEDTTPVKFNWLKGDPNKCYGYIAQDLLRAGFPDLVNLAVDETIEEVIDDDGFISPEGVKFTVSYQHIIPILAKNQKRLMRENAELRAKLDAILDLLAHQK